MSTGGRLTRKIGVVAVGRAASALSIYMVYALVARAWSPEECGVFLAVWVIGNVLIPIFLLGLPTSLLYFFPRRENQRALVGQAAVCLLVSAAGLVGVLSLWGTSLADWLAINESQDASLAIYLWPFLPYIFALVAGGFAESVLVASNREIWLAWLQLAMGLGLVAGAGATLYPGLRPAELLALFSCLGMLRLVVSGWLVHRALGRGKGWWTREDFGELMHYTRPIGYNDAVGSLSRSVDRLVVLHFFAAGTFAQYNFGAIEVPVSLLLASVVAVLVPEISRLFQEERLEEIRLLWQRAVSRLAILVLPLAAFLLVFADPIIGWIFPEAYARSAWVFRLYLLVLPLRCAVYNPLLVGMGKARWALWSSLGDLGCNLLLSLTLVGYLQGSRPDLAFLGPAIATVSSTYLQVGFLLMAISWHLNWGLRRLLPWARLLRIGVGAGGAAVASRWFTVGLDGDFMQLSAGAFCFALVVGVLAWSHPVDRAELIDTFGALVRTER